MEIHIVKHLSMQLSNERGVLDVLTKKNLQHILLEETSTEWDMKFLFKEKGRIHTNLLLFA